MCGMAHGASGDSGVSMSQGVNVMRIVTAGLTLLEAELAVCLHPCGGGLQEAQATTDCCMPVTTLWSFPVSLLTCEACLALACIPRLHSCLCGLVHASCMHLCMNRVCTCACVHVYMYVHGAGDDAAGLQATCMLGALAPDHALHILEVRQVMSKAKHQAGRPLLPSAVVCMDTDA